MGHLEHNLMKKGGTSNGFKLQKSAEKHWRGPNQGGSAWYTHEVTQQWKFDRNVMLIYVMKITEKCPQGSKGIEFLHKGIPRNSAWCGQGDLNYSATFLSGPGESGVQYIGLDVNNETKEIPSVSKQMIFFILKGPLTTPFFSNWEQIICFSMNKLSLPGMTCCVTICNA